MSTSKKSKITAENREESTRLKALWDAAAKTRRSQAEFAEAYDLGTQGNVGHYLLGRSALNPKAAAAFAAELNCRISEFSQRIAREIAQLNTPLNPADVITETMPPHAEWPFDPAIVSKERYMALPLGVRSIVQVRLMDIISEQEAQIAAKQAAPRKAASRAA